MAPRGRVFPQLIVNLKAYRETLGTRAVALSKAAARLEAQLGVRIAVCPQSVDVRACAETGVRVFAQNFDRVGKPEVTGWQSLDALIDAGCVGSLINHSEHRLEPDDVQERVLAARAAKIASVLCTRDSEESGEYAGLKPDMVAVEPPELIGGEISVTSADPGVVRRSVQAVERRAPGTPVLCGAGVKSGKDVARAVELGAYGILVASGVTRAKNPANALRLLAEGFRARRGDNA